MAYAATRTWLPGDTFPYTEHNTYIRDNLKAVRMFQHVGQPVRGGPITLNNSSGTTVVSLLNIESNLIDEPWELQVVAYMFACGNSSTGSVTVTMQDNVGATLAVAPGSFYISNDANYPLCALMVGTLGLPPTGYPANSAKPGFTVKMQLQNATAGKGWATAFAYIRPTSTIVRP